MKSAVSTTKQVKALLVDNAKTTHFSQIWKNPRKALEVSQNRAPSTYSEGNSHIPTQNSDSGQYLSPALNPSGLFYYFMPLLPPHKVSIILLLYE